MTTNDSWIASEEWVVLVTSQDGAECRMEGGVYAGEQAARAAVPAAEAACPGMLVGACTVDEALELIAG